MTKGRGLQAEGTSQPQRPRATTAACALPSQGHDQGGTLPQVCVRASQLARRGMGKAGHVNVATVALRHDDALPNGWHVRDTSNIIARSATADYSSLFRPYGSRSALGSTRYAPVLQRHTQATGRGERTIWVATKRTARFLMTLGALAFAGLPQRRARRTSMQGQRRRVAPLPLGARPIAHWRRSCAEHPSRARRLRHVVACQGVRRELWRCRKRSWTLAHAQALSGAALRFQSRHREGRRGRLMRTACASVLL